MTSNIIKYPSKSVYVSTAHPNTNFNGYYGLFFGSYIDSIIYRTLLNFDLSDVPKGYLIKNANLIIKIIRNDYTSYEKEFGVYIISEDFNENTVTFNNHPNFYINPITTFKITDEVDCIYSIDISDIFSKWYHDQISVYGIMIKAIDENVNSLIATYSINCGCYDLYPRLTSKLVNPIQISNVSFKDEIETSLITTNNFNSSSYHNVSQMKNYSWFVKNTGIDNTAKIVHKISPNLIDWINDSKEYIAKPNEMICIIPKIYCKYSKLEYKSEIPSATTSLDIYFQGQT